MDTIIKTLIIIIAGFTSTAMQAYTQGMNGGDYYGNLCGSMQKCTNFAFGSDRGFVHLPDLSWNVKSLLRNKLVLFCRFFEDIQLSLLWESIYLWLCSFVSNF